MKENLKKAFDFVNQEDIFNPENYPAIRNLTEEEKNYFILNNYTFWRMQGNVEKLLVFEQYDFSFNDDYKKVVLKILVNIIRLSHQVKLTPYEISELEEQECVSLGNSCVILMTIISIQCESFYRDRNHQDLTQGILGELKVKEALKILWKAIFYILNNYFDKKLILENALVEICSNPKIA